MNCINYTIVRASGELLDRLYAEHITHPEVQKYKHDRITYAACGEDSRILGYITASDKGSDWFVHVLRVMPDCRRQGIGTALVQALIREADEADARHLTGSTASPSGYAFWEHAGAILFPYGKPHEDGSFSHFFTLRLHIQLHMEAVPPVIRPTPDTQLDAYFREHILPKNPTFYEGKRPLMSALTAYRADGAELGFIAGYRESVDGCFTVAFLRVMPDCRRQGIGTALVQAMAAEADADGHPYLRAVSPDALYDFWYRLGFSVFDWKLVGKSNTILTALQRFR